jgi:hypothetical protein
VFLPKGHLLGVLFPADDTILEVLENLGGGTLLEKVGHWGVGPWGTLSVITSCFSLCFLATMKGSCRSSCSHCHDTLPYYRPRINGDKDCELKQLVSAV